MFSSQILDVAIGLVFLYFFLSLLCSVIIEMATSLTKKRPRMLKDGILSLLQDPGAVDRFYKQPLFMGNTTPKGLLGSLGQSLQALVPCKKTVPRVPVVSYISSRSFVLSLLESLKQYPEVVKNLAIPNKIADIQKFKDTVESLPDTSKIKTVLLPLLQGEDNATLNRIHEWYDEVKNNPDISKELLESFKANIPPIDDLEQIKTLVSALPSDSTIKRALMPLLESAGTGADALDKAFDQMEKWYDEAMARVTGWYKRYSQTIALVLALIVALALNADTFEIGRALYRDPSLRTSIVAMAQDAVKKGNPVTQAASNRDQKKDIDSIKSMDAGIKKMETLNLPLGWDQWFENNKDELIKNNISDANGDIKNYKKLVRFSLPTLFGILFTALMVSLGSNFWFDLLNKLVNLRNAGQKPLTKEEKEAKKG
jgi:hypothetical protein